MPYIPINAINITRGTELTANNNAVVTDVIQQLNELLTKTKTNAALFSYDRVRSIPLSTMQIPYAAKDLVPGLEFTVRNEVEGLVVYPGLEPFASALMSVTQQLLRSDLAQLNVSRLTRGGFSGSDPVIINSGYGMLLNQEKLLIQPQTTRETKKFLEEV